MPLAPVHSLIQLVPVPPVRVLMQPCDSWPQTAARQPQKKTQSKEAKHQTTHQPSAKLTWTNRHRVTTLFQLVVHCLTRVARCEKWCTARRLPSARSHTVKWVSPHLAKSANFLEGQFSQRTGLQSPFSIYRYSVPQFGAQLAVNVATHTKTRV